MSVISNSLAGMGYQKLNIQTALLCLVINVAANFLAIPHFGANGAALASTMAFSVTALYTVVLYKKIMIERLRIAAIEQAETK
jgi:O-antigen/teichoic acid export membrane protein